MFTIRYQTTVVRPDLQVTLRSSIDGWARDEPGIFADDAWSFTLDTARFAAGFEFKFVLDRQVYMSGADLRIDAPADGQIYTYGQGAVTFPAMTEAIVENGAVQQKFFPPNLDTGHEYDVIVIGSGIGGGVLADQLADSGLEVLVLEAGSYLFPTHVGNLPRRHAFGQAVDKNIWGLWQDFRTVNYVNAPGSQFGGAQAFMAGGRSVFWGGFIPRMSWWETDLWPEPVRWDLENYAYDLAEALLGKSAPDSVYQRRAVAGISAPLGEFVAQTAPMAIQQGDGQRRTIATGMFSTADLLLESRLTPGRTGAANLSINLNHAVVQLETDGDRVTGVVADDLLGATRRTFRARAVVVSAGTVESAKIAQLSGLADPNEQIGRGITDHPIFFTHFAVPASSPYYDPAASAKILLRHQQSGMNTGAPHLDDHRYIAVLELGTDFNQGRFVDPDVLAEHLRLRGDTMLCEMVFLFSAGLGQNNSVTQNGPSFVKPVVDMAESPISAGEWDEIESVKNRVLAELGGIALPGDDLVADRAGLGGVSHEAGTLRMGTDGQSGYSDGVVDTDLKFLAYQNLYACDLSVFPASPAANPTLTLAALSLRLARHLVATLPPR